MSMREYLGVQSPDEAVGGWQPAKAWHVALCQRCDPLTPVPFRDDPDGRDGWVADHVRTTGHLVILVDHDPDNRLLRAPAMIRYRMRSACATPGALWSMLCGATACQRWITELASCAEAVGAWYSHDCRWQPIERND